MPQKKYVQTDTNLNGRRLVISDIHGCLKTFIALLEKLNFNKTDRLFLLGDYIDRGPDSKGVLDHIMYLQDQKYQVFPVRGNHEDELLNAYNEYDRETFVFYVKKMAKNTAFLDDDGKIISRYYAFLQNLPWYIELPDYYIVHAGFNYKDSAPFKDYSAMLNLRFDYKEYETDFLNGKRLVRGHQPTEIEIIKKAVESRSMVIPLDNGCVYRKKHKIYDHTKLGKLACLDLDTLELHLNENIDIPRE